MTWVTLTTCESDNFIISLLQDDFSFLIKTTPSQSMGGVHKGMWLKASFPFVDKYLEVSDGDKLG